MTESLRALLTGVIDYAGMFPPASLPMDQAIRNYARYRTEPEAWMLGRFICPAVRLAELSPYVYELFREGPPLEVSALARGGADEKTFLDGLHRDLDDIKAFRARHEGRTTVDCIETKYPLIENGDDYEATCEMTKKMERSINAMEFPGFSVFLEPLPVENQFELMARRTCLQAHHSFIGEYGRGGGCKIRCGGTDAKAFPNSEDLAWGIFSGGLLHILMKFTAGLHHPVRHFNLGMQCKMHGFLNVFVAGVFVEMKFRIRDDGSAPPIVANVRAENVQEILEDENASNFQFTDDGLTWRDLRASVTDIESTRRDFVTSFGSCSFDEPREDLKALGLL